MLLKNEIFIYQYFPFLKCKLKELEISAQIRFDNVGFCYKKVELYFKLYNSYNKQCIIEKINCFSDVHDWL